MTEVIAFLKTLKTIVSLIKNVVDMVDNHIQKRLDEAFEERKRKVNATIGQHTTIVESDKPDSIKDEELRNSLRNRKK